MALPPSRAGSAFTSITAGGRASSARIFSNSDSRFSGSTSGFAISSARVRISALSSSETGGSSAFSGSGPAHGGKIVRFDDLVMGAGVDHGGVQLFKTRGRLVSRIVSNGGAAMSSTDGRYNSGMGENNNGAVRVRIQSQVWDCSGGWFLCNGG